MAVKQHTTRYEEDTMLVQEANEARPTPMPIDITFHCKGLTQIGKEEFTLEGVPIMDLEYKEHVELLVGKGLDRRLAEDAVEDMMESLHLKMMAFVLADRMKVHRG